METKVQFQMYSARADDAVLAACNKVADRARDRVKLPDQVYKMCQKVAEEFPEVWDTEPQWAISDWMTANVCKPRMWQEISRWDW